jgi:hypothetical protein
MKYFLCYICGNIWCEKSKYQGIRKCVCCQNDSHCFIQGPSLRNEFKCICGEIWHTKHIKKTIKCHNCKKIVKSTELNESLFLLIEEILECLYYIRIEDIKDNNLLKIMTLQDKFYKEIEETYKRQVKKFIKDKLREKKKMY